MPGVNSILKPYLGSFSERLITPILSSPPFRNKSSVVKAPSIKPLHLRIKFAPTYSLKLKNIICIFLDILCSVTLRVLPFFLSCDFSGNVLERDER
jgi:hypothetical protein